MEYILSVENMRESDKYTIENKVSSKELMFRAGKGIFESVNWKGNVCIVCGSGNNAGDGYVIATLLFEIGILPKIILLKDKFSADGRYYFDKCLSLGIPYSIYNGEKFENFDIIVDCIFGTGFKGEVKGEAKEIINTINESGAYIVSVDINSGLNGDNGLGDTVVKSDLTVSVGSYQPGHFLGKADECIKSRKNCDIGITPILPPYYLCEKMPFDDFNIVDKSKLESFDYNENPVDAVIKYSAKNNKTAVKNGGKYIVSDGEKGYIVI